MQMKLKLTVAAAVMAMGGLALAQGTQTVVIGSVAPMSGPQAHYGTDNANGVLMAVNDLNKEGMEIGGK
ncbi:MAG TPA: branched-chain amino acid ABC transporter substrate-binding protein, partial [Rhodoferax sp.]|nr:branched-chain amino acid ABC transporter substrate-binding protein [Rhodoferax sp.]